jgi:predicted dinucleotide-binding enzyme
MNIGFIGAGNMARVLGTLWARAGHDVMFSSRTAERAKRLADFAGGRAHSGTFQDAAAFGDVVVLAVAWEAAADTARALAQSIEGKVVVDVSNAISTQTLELELDGERSYAEEIAACAPKARVVKAFNTIFQEILEVDRDLLQEHGVSCFLAGDDEDAKVTVSQLAEDIGLSVVDTGGLAMARSLEHAALLIIKIGFVQRRGAYSALNVIQLPEPAELRLGGRRYES